MPITEKLLITPPEVFFQTKDTVETVFVNEYTSLTEWLNSVWSEPVNPANAGAQQETQETFCYDKSITLHAGEEHSITVEFPSCADLASMRRAFFAKNESALAAYKWARRAIIEGIGGLPNVESPPPEEDWKRGGGRLSISRAIIEENPYCFARRVDKSDESESDSFGDVVTILLDTSTGTPAARLWSAIVGAVFCDIAEEQGMRVQVLSAERAHICDGDGINKKACKKGQVGSRYTDYIITAPLKDAGEKANPSKILASGHPKMLQMHFAAMFQRRRDYLYGSVGAGAGVGMACQKAYYKCWKTKYPSATPKTFFVVPPCNTFAQATLLLRQLIKTFNLS